jgi:V/A-type H+-transporting ATPase subunit C
MADFDYGNARLRVMKSRLLTQRELEVLADAGSLQGLIAALAKTVYQKSVESVLTRASGMQCIDETLRLDLVNTIGKIRGFYNEGAGRMVAFILRIYDIHNLKAILRGLEKNVPADEILAILLPIGELDIRTLRELAQLNDPREAIDLLVSMRISFAQPLINLRAEVPGAETFEMELALDQWYYHDTHEILQSEAGMEDPLSFALALDADLANVLTILRFAHNPQERNLIRDRMRTDEIERMFVASGRIPFSLLAHAFRQDSIITAVEILSGTFLGPALHAGLSAYAHSNLLSDIEKHLRRYRLHWMTAQITKDPLGIGVVLGYLALKVNEVANIRWIAQGINLGLEVDSIQAEVEIAL